MAGSAKLTRAVDVYDMAVDIGGEFETIIDQCGAPVLATLVPKVINVLEQLERVAARCEEESRARREQRRIIDKLHAEKSERAGERLRFDKELEEFEERTKQEISELRTTVNAVQCDNARLRQMCDQQVDSGLNSHSDQADGDCKISNEADLESMMSLKSLLDRQKDELLAKETVCQEKREQLDETLLELEKSRRLVGELRRRHRHQLQLNQQLQEERTSLQLEAAEIRHQLNDARQRLGTSQKENHDLSTSVDEVMKNMIVYDRDDPDRPRFTISELRDILNERNELKSRLSDVQDELNMYRPPTSDRWRESSIICPPSDELDSMSSSELSSPPSLQNELDQCRMAEDERPVQGPLPADPDNAPWKRQESGIRRLFRRMFGTSPSPSPRRSISSIVLSPAAVSPVRRISPARDVLEMLE